MKKVLKAVSAFMAVLMMLSVFSIMTFAADEANIRFSVEAVSSSEVNGAEGIYKVTCEVKTSVPVVTNLIPILYDKTLFAPVCSNSTSYAKPTTAANWRRTAAASRRYIACDFLGDYADENYYLEDGVTPDEDNGIIAGLSPVLGTSKLGFTTYNVPTSNMGTLSTDKYNAIIFQQELADGMLCLNCPDWEAVFAIYFYALDTSVDVTGAEFGCISGGRKAEMNKMSNNELYYSTEIQVDGVGFAAVPTVGTSTTYGSAVASGPSLAKTKGQVKMTPTSETTVADEFSYRVISSIPSADWDAYFSATGSTATATTPNSIQELGMVCYVGGDFSLATAKTVVEDGAQVSNYLAGSTTYVNHTDGNDASFGTTIILPRAADLTYLGYVKYVDASGATAYAYYAAEETALLSSNYESIVASYLLQFPYGG